MRLALPWKNASLRPAEACAAAPGVLAFLVLLCWVLGNGRIAALGRHYVPMHALTASLMLLLSCGVVLHCRWPSQPAARGFALLAVAGVEVMSLLVWGQYLFGFDLSLLRWLTPATPAVADIPRGPMSPLSATAFMCAGLALLCELSPWGRRWWCRQTTAVLALITWSMSLVVLLLYAAGMPLLYGGRTVPTSIVTAVSFSLLSVGILLAAGLDTLPLSLFQTAPRVDSRPSRHRFLVVPVLTFVFLAGGIGAVGYAYFRHQVAAAREAVQLTMSANARSSYGALQKFFALVDRCTSSVSPTRSLDPQGPGGFPSRRFGTLFMTDGT